MYNIIHNENFYVIAVISNPVRYRSRVRLFKQFEEQMKADGATLLVVELAFGHRPFEVTHAGNPWHLQLRSFSELWHKENLCNLGLRRLAELVPDYSTVAFIDADITFARSHWLPERRDWISETVHQLQHYDVVQMFQTALDLGPRGECFGKYEGFAWAYLEGKFDPQSFKYTSFHPGFCWAWRRDALSRVGNLLQYAILGAGDRHMAFSLVSMAKYSLHPGLDPHYATSILEWEKRADRYIQHNIGFVPGTIYHHWHGSKRRRFYHDRWKILVNNQYNPYTDLKTNDQGVLELVVMDRRQMKLRDDIRAYFRSREEDSIDNE